MNLGREQLREIAARASTFDERLRNGYLIPHPECDESEIDRRLERWRDRATKGNARMFEELLVLRGLDLGSVRRGLGRVKLSDPDEVPEWTCILADCLETEKKDGEGQPGIPRFCNAAEPLPFEQILTPFVETAANRLRKQAGTAYVRLENKAQAAIERMLLAWLAGPCGSALILEFSLFRYRTRSEGSAPEISTEHSSELYHRFVQNMLDGGFANFLAEYCVLARAIATIIDHWVSAMAEFLERLDTDFHELVQAFDNSSQDDRVADIRTGLSDPHHRGRTVLALKFGSGLKLIYKPKSLDTESAFNHLLEWVNEHCADLKLRSLKVLSRPGYGWVEYLEHTPCANEAQLGRFYQRSGMLLALFHVLTTTDVHAENLIAVGEFPTLVDAETLITPQLGSKNGLEQQETSELRTAWHLNESVLNTQMLPNWRKDGQAVTCDLSGLGGVGGEEIEAPIWVGAHTDGMERQVSTVAVGRNQNVPFPPDQAAEPGRFVEQIVGGFENVCSILINNRDALLAPGGPLELLARAPMRLVFRETQTYFNILKKSFDPSVLRDGADRSVDLEVLSRILCISNPRTRHLPLVEVEKRSLENLDIPAFTTFPATRNLNAGPEQIAEDYFSESGYANAVGKIRELSMERCAEQCAVIRGSFYAKKLNQREVSSRELSKKPIAPDELVSAAVEIGELLQKEAIRGEDRSASWIGLVYKPSFAAFRYLPLAEDLFEGQAGVALFLAALARVTGREAFRELAEGAMLPLRRFIRFALDDTGWKKVNDGKIESALLIYPLVQVSELLDDFSLITLAGDAASLVTSELLGRIPDLGLPNGITAILLGLLALRNVAKDDGILKRAILCGDYLLQRKEQPVIGRDFAFRRLYEITSDARFNGPMKQTSMKRWLPGMLGVGLDLLRDTEPRQADCMSEWLEASLRQVFGNELMQLDSVAEGNFGLVELTLEAAEKLSRPNLLSLGVRLATETAMRAKNNGGYRIYSGIPQNAPCFGYLRGFAGIGYTLLRACTPELRSILQWN